MVRVRPLAVATRLVVALQTAVQHAPPPHRNDVVVSRTIFAVARFALFGFHAICAALYAVWSYVHVASTLKSEALMLDYLGLIVSHTAFSFAGGVYMVCTIAHMVSAAGIVVASVRHAEPSAKKPTCCGATATTSRIYRNLLRPIARIYAAVQYRYADELFVVQEAVEIVLLSIRAYGFSRWQPHGSPLLRAYVALLVLNCWSTPLIERLLRNAKTTQRMLCHVFDMVSDLVSTLLLPAAMAWPQLPLFDRDFVWYRGSEDAIEMSRAQGRAFQGVAQTWFDVANIVVFSYFLYTRVRGIKGALKCRDQRVGVVAVTSLHPVASVHPPNKPMTTTTTHRLVDRVMRVIHMLAVTWGCVVAVAHVVSETQSTYAWCRGQTAPWFTNNARCETVYLDCAANGIHGRHAELERVLTAVEPVSVLSLTIVNCDALEMPPAIQKLSIVHSSVVQWSSSSALLHQYQPELQSLTISDTLFPNGTLPEGLCCSGELPRLLMKLVFDRTNLSTFPEQLDTVWHDPLRLSLNGNAFTRVPDVVTRLPLVDLSMDSNQLTAVSEGDVTCHQTFCRFSFAQNPIQKLPETLSTALTASEQSFPFLVFNDTALTRLPAWTWRMPGLVATGSPFCRALLDVPRDERIPWLVREDINDTVAAQILDKVVCD